MPALPRSVLSGPKVRIPHRAYYLFCGSLPDLWRWGPTGYAARSRVHLACGPHLVRAGDVDPHWAGLGAPAADALSDQTREHLAGQLGVPQRGPDAAHGLDHVEKRPRPGDREFDGSPTAVLGQHHQDTGQLPGAR